MPTPFLLNGIMESAKTGRGPSVTGGTLYSDATYYYRAFTTTGTLTVSGGSLTADVLVVAGGGGGGDFAGGGGGAGGVLGFASQVLTPNSYSVTVGAGGAGSTPAVNGGSNGGNSQFGSLTSTIGGGLGTLNNGATTNGATGG